MRFEPTAGGGGGGEEEEDLQGDKKNKCNNYSTGTMVGGSI